MSRSADVSFRLIGLAKKILTKDQVARARAESKRRGVSLEQAVSDLAEISADQFERILRTRRRHGRNCVECGRPTYLLPGQNEDNTPCEHCGNALLGQEDAGSRSLRPDGIRDTRKRRERIRPKPKPPPPPPPEPPKPRRPESERRKRPEYFETGPRPALSEADLYGTPAPVPAPLGDPLDDSGLLFSDEALGHDPAQAATELPAEPGYAEQPGGYAEQPDAAPAADEYVDPGAESYRPPDGLSDSPYAAFGDPDFGDPDDEPPAPRRRRPGDPSYGD